MTGSSRDGKSPFAMTHYEDIPDQFFKKYMLEGIYGEGEMSVVYGLPGCGKSVVLGDQAVHVAAGLDWFGRRTRQGAVLYVAAERAALMKRRLAAIRKFHNIRNAPVAILEGVFDLCSSQDHTQTIIEHVNDLQARTGHSIGWIIIDTKNQVLGGGDPNSDRDISGLNRNIQAIFHTFPRVHVTVVDHVPHTSPTRMKGSGALAGAADASFLVEKGNDGVRSIRVGSKEPNDGDGELKVMFTLHSVELGVDDFGHVTTAPVVISTGSPLQVTKSDKMGSQKLSSASCLILNAFERLTRDGDTVPVPKNLFEGNTDIVGVSVDRLRSTAFEMKLGGGGQVQTLPDQLKHKESWKKSWQRAIKDLKEKKVFHEGLGIVWRANRS